MPDTVDVTKMKVADLKRELKIRGLSITGNKNELTERLQSALIDGELLDDTVISGEELLDEDGVLTDEEEKILNENDLLESPKLDKPSLCDILEEKEAAQANNAPGIAKKLVLKRKISTNILSDLGVDDNLVPASKLTKKIESTTEQATSATDAGAAAAGKKVTQLTAQERLEMRAKKFGLSATNDTTENKTTASTETKVITKDATTSEAEAAILKKRAERFGCVVSSKMVELDVQDRLQKRKERFGGASVTFETKPTDVKPTNDVWAQKARQRLERFKNSETKTVNA